jgi:hypothetical protein
MEGESPRLLGYSVDQNKRQALPVLDRTRLVMAVAGGKSQECDGPRVMAEATAAFARAAAIANPPEVGQFASVTGSVEYIDGRTVRHIQ